jgi:hypothetical protein
MIDSTVLGSLLMLLAGVLGFSIKGLVTSLMYSRKQRSDSEKAASDGDLITKKAQADLISSVAATADSSVKILQQVMAVVERNTSAADASAAKMEGMVLTLAALAPDVKIAIGGMLEAQTGINDIKSNVLEIKGVTTSLGDDIKDQFAPVVDAMRDIGKRLDLFVIEIQQKDGHTNARLTELSIAFTEAEKRFVSMLEPIVIKHLADQTTPKLIENGHIAEKDTPHETL